MLNKIIPSTFIISVAIISVAATILILAALNFIFFKRLLHQIYQIKIKKNQNWRPVLLVLSGVTVIVVILFVLSIPLSSRAFYCQSCHVMRAEYQTWKRSTHNEISCYTCHRDPGVTGYLIQKLKETRMLISYLAGSSEKSIVSEVKDSVCLKCHEKIRVGLTIGLKIRMSHKELLQKGVRCGECHNTIVHEKAVPVQNLPTMEKCTPCHNNQISSGQCKLCHVKVETKELEVSSSSWGMTHRNNWLKVHGMKDLGVCIACHSKEDCAGECHDQMPHPDNWNYIHGKSAINAKKACLDCHIIDAFCRDCHQVEMPHAQNWLPEHSTEAKKEGKQLCLTCHLEEDCNFCHIRHKAHPTVKKATPG